MPKKNQPFDMEQWQNDTGNDLYGQISREVNRHNYGLLLSDQKMEELRKIIYRMVSRWSRNEKVAIIGDYGDANLISGSESEGKINRILTETLIINMDAEKLEALAAGTKSKLAGLQKKAEGAQKNADARGKKIKSALLNMMKTFNKLKDSKDQKEYTKHIKDDGLVPSKIIKGNYKKLKQELTEYLQTKNIMELRNLAGALGIEVNEEDRVGPKELINRIFNLAALYLDIITGKQKNLYYGNVIHNTEVLDNLLSYTSWGFLVGDGTGMSPEEAQEKRRQAVLNKKIQKARLQAMKARKGTLTKGFESVAGFKSLTDIGAKVQIAKNDKGFLKDASIEEVTALAAKYGIEPSKSIATMKLGIYKAAAAQASLYRKYNKQVEKNLAAGLDDRQARDERDAIGATLPDSLTSNVISKNLIGVTNARNMDTNSIKFATLNINSDSIEITPADVNDATLVLEQFQSMFCTSEPLEEIGTATKENVDEADVASRYLKNSAAKLLKKAEDDGTIKNPLTDFDAKDIGYGQYIYNVILFMLMKLNVKLDVLFQPIVGRCVIHNGQAYAVFLDAIEKVRDNFPNISDIQFKEGVQKAKGTVFKLSEAYAVYWAYLYLIATKNMSKAKALKKDHKWLPPLAYKDVVRYNVHKERAKKVFKVAGKVGAVAGIAALAIGGLFGAAGAAVAGIAILKLVKNRKKIGKELGKKFGALFKGARKTDDINDLPERDKAFIQQLLKYDLASLEAICRTSFGIDKYTKKETKVEISPSSGKKKPKEKKTVEEVKEYSIYDTINETINGTDPGLAKDIKKHAFIYMIAVKKGYKSAIKYLEQYILKRLEPSVGKDFIKNLKRAAKGGALKTFGRFLLGAVTFKGLRERFNALKLGKTGKNQAKGLKAAKKLGGLFAAEDDDPDGEAERAKREAEEEEKNKPINIIKEAVLGIYDSVKAISSGLGFEEETEEGAEGEEKSSKKKKGSKKAKGIAIGIPKMTDKEEKVYSKALDTASDSIKSQKHRAKLNAEKVKRAENPDGQYLKQKEANKKKKDGEVLNASKAVSHEARGLALTRIIKKPADPVYVVNWNNRDPAYEWLSQNMPIFASGFMSPFIPAMFGIAPTMLSLSIAEGVAISAAQASGMVAYAKGSKKIDGKKNPYLNAYATGTKNVNAKKGGNKNNAKAINAAKQNVNKNKKVANAGIPPIAITQDPREGNATPATPIKPTDFKKVPDYVPKYATGTKDVATTQFISGDSLNSSPNPELVSIDWENKSAAVKPIPQNKAIKAQSSPNPLSNKERNLPLNVSIKGNVVRYSSISLPEHISDDGSNEAMKVFNIRNPLTETISVGGNKLSAVDILASIGSTLQLLLETATAGNNMGALTAQSTATAAELLKQSITQQNNRQVSTAAETFTNSLDNILKGH